MDTDTPHSGEVPLQDDSRQSNAVEVTPDGIAFQTRLRYNFIDNMISHLQELVELTPDNDPNKPIHLSNLGCALQTRFTWLESLADIDNAFSSLQKAVELAPDDNPEKPKLLNNLGTALLQRFERLGKLEDLDGAIASLQKGVKLTPYGHPNIPSQLNNLGNALKAHFLRLGNVTYIDTAIVSLQNAVELTPDGHPSKGGRLNNLGVALQARFRHTRNLTDINDAIVTLRKAEELVPDDHPSKPKLVENLGMAFDERFNRFDGLVDIDDAIANLQKAAELTPDGNPGKPSVLNALGAAFQGRFRRLGSRADMDDAITNLRRAVELVPKEHPEKPKLLGNLGIMLEGRFQQLGSLSDIDGAIASLQEAVDLIPDDYPGKPSALSNLVSALAGRFRRTHNLTDIDDAISLSKKALDLTTPDGHPDKSARFSSLGVALQGRFERTRNPLDMDDAVTSLRKAVALTPDDHPDKAKHLNNFGTMLHVCFRNLSNLTDIDEAIASLQKADQLVPDGHPDKTSILKNLGYAHNGRFERVGSLHDLESALQSFSSVATSLAGPATIRFDAARTWARILDMNRRSPLHAYGRAIDLLAQIAWLGLSIADQQANMADVGDIVREAVAAAIKWEDLKTAVEWAEQGRSIVWQNLLGLRTPVAELRATNPQLAEKLESVARQLEVSPTNNLDEMDRVSIGNVTRTYSALAREWENLVEEIRRIPGFQGFLLAKRFSQLAPAAREGHIVILNVHESRSDALVLSPGESGDKPASVINIPLRNFSQKISQQMLQSMTGLLSSVGVRTRCSRKTGRFQPQTGADITFTRILRVLWLDVVKPVIDGLSYQVAPVRTPRVWWCPTGMLAFLPIHAAGLYDTQELGHKLSDYVISSYTPTLTAILDPVESNVPEDFQVLTVAQPSTPYAAPLPSTESEVDLIKVQAGSVKVVSLANGDATVERVLQEMSKSNWIHLACHGGQNTADPMKSGFLLHDRTLELSEIVKLSLPKADFAFLSACQTATGDEKLAEESVHLATGMLLSGCRGVIATMWSIRDQDGPQIAEGVYGRIFKDGRPNRKEAAHALHDAVKGLRGSGADFLSWVPFIHIGR